MYLNETDSMSNMAKLAKEDALNLLDGAVNIIDVDALKDIKQAIEDKAGNATEMADKAETAFGDANDIEELFYETVGKINTFVDEIMEAKMTAH
jgi:methyl-accepting chemotaxis protein